MKNKRCIDCYHCDDVAVVGNGKCSKYNKSILKLGSPMKDNCFVDKNKVENLLNELYKDVGVKYNEYVIWFASNDNIRLRIKHDDDKYISEDYVMIGEYIEDNYGSVVYEIIELDGIETIKI